MELGVWIGAAPLPVEELAAAALADDAVVDEITLLAVLLATVDAGVGAAEICVYFMVEPFSTNPLLAALT